VTPGSRGTGGYDPDTLPIGILGRPHGVGGEIIFRPHDQGSDVVMGLDHLLLVRAGGKPESFRLRSVRPVADGFLVRFEGVGDRDAAAKLTLAEVRVPRGELPALEPGEYYVEDLAGCSVEDENGRALGTVRETFWNGAHDVCTVIGPAGEERLIPLVPDFVIEVDTPGRKMRVLWQDDWGQ
jgi:16S rRNA processing protein RimM